MTPIRWSLVLFKGGECVCPRPFNIAHIIQPEAERESAEAAVEVFLHLEFSCEVLSRSGVQDFDAI